MAREIKEQGQTSCRRCGTCCINGGPALHGDDLALVKDHRLAQGDLIAIRQGEPVVSPLSNGVEPARTELIKISGRGESWACRLFDQSQNACGIYGHRPLECRLLKCWRPSALTEVIYRDCLRRQDILPEDEELRGLIALQEEHCSFADLDRLAKEFAEENGTRPLSEIARIVTLDLRIREHAIQSRGLRLEEELLVFGRPMFKSLPYYRLRITEGPRGLTVSPMAAVSTEKLS